MPTLALVFIAATVLWTIVSLQLSLRQSTHVRAQLRAAGPQGSRENILDMRSSHLT